MNFTPVGNLDAVEGICIIKACEKKTSVKGGAYLDLTLADKSGEISAKLWDYKPQSHGEYAVNELVKVRGTISQYNGMDQFKVDRIRRVNSDDNVNIEDFVPSVEYSGEYMLAEIESCIQAFSDEDLKKIVGAILKRYKDEILYWPAAFKLHHALRGGLLYHTLSILRLAEKLCEIYPSIDRDLLFSGVILHDIAKIEEFEVGKTGIASGYTVEGNLIGHLVRGAIVIEETAKELEIPREKAMLLQHMVISHHGDPEFGAAMRPMFLEAEVLSQLDLIDARIYEISQVTEGMSAGEFSGKQWFLENRKLYNHGRKKTEPVAKL